jgi:hypothetical protein
MKFLLFILFPLTLFAQEKNDSVNSNLKNKVVLSMYQIGKTPLQNNSINNFDDEMKSLGVRIRNNQQIEEYSYKWIEEKSYVFNVVGEILNNIINHKKLNP